jgi:site-specific DNA-methyltransferase (cytosine-N4-specific)
VTALVIRADARQLPLPDASVDLIVTSPPYWGQRSYADGGEHYAAQIGDEPSAADYIDALIDCTREWVRVLKPSGSLFVNLGDKYAGGGMGGHGPGLVGTRPQGEGNSYRRTKANGPKKSLMLLPERYRIACVDTLGMTARAVVIWSKANPLPESVTDRVRRSHEDWVHLTLGPTYFADMDEIRKPPSGYARTNRPARSTPEGIKARTMTDSCNPLGSVPGSVWEMPSEPLTVPDALGTDHFAAFPTEWPRRLIKGWSPVGGLVVDPFGGTGTTALVADALGRQGVTVDRSADYCRIARWRTTDPGQRAKALGVDKPPVELPGQASLLDLVGVTL